MLHVRPLVVSPITVLPQFSQRPRDHTDTLARTICRTVRLRGGLLPNSYTAQYREHIMERPSLVCIPWNMASHKIELWTVVRALELRRGCTGDRGAAGSERAAFLFGETEKNEGG